jgi:hypothetical protein
MKTEWKLRAAHLITEQSLVQTKLRTMMCSIVPIRGPNGQPMSSSDLVGVAGGWLQDSLCLVDMERRLASLHSRERPRRLRRCWANSLSLDCDA